MLVAICMPRWRKRWFLFTFGVLADGNTCRFLCPLYKQRSGRLSPEWVVIAFNQTLTDDQTGIAIGISLHATLRTEDQRDTRGIALRRLPLFVASHQAMATSTLSAGVSWVDPTAE